MRAGFVLAMLVSALGACVGDTQDDVDDSDADVAERKKPKPTPPPPPPPDTSGSVSCYSDATPTATCSAPSVCCFGTGFDPDGSCSSSTCSWGSVSCDGPEDCASGQRCCSSVTATGVQVACATSCLHYTQGGDEICHEPSICDGGRWCVTAFGTNPALPRNLSICR